MAPRSCEHTKRLSNMEYVQVVNGGELISDIQGETEQVVRGVFVAARALVPCVLFLDECDAFSPPREGMASGIAMGNLQGATGAAMQALGELMHEFDVLDKLRGDAAYALLSCFCLCSCSVVLFCCNKP
jgi:SpoVK/Ycf46/Vps4 family AAA+-type ATPase